MSSIPLEELIKTNLENYEARYDSNDWARMETVLGTTPDSRPFNWKPVLIVLIVLGLAGGGYVLFTTVDFSKSFSKSTTPPSTTPTVVKKAPVTPPVKTETPRPTPVINVDSIRRAEEAKSAAALAAKEEEERIQREEAEKEEARLKKERRKEEPSKEDIELRRARRRAMANADSNKTNNNSSNESAKEQDKPKSTHIGLNIFSTMNADSLKKYQEKVKKDSTK